MNLQPNQQQELLQEINALQNQQSVPTYLQILIVSDLPQENQHGQLPSPVEQYNQYHPIMSIYLRFYDQFQTSVQVNQFDIQQIGDKVQTSQQIAQVIQNHTGTLRYLFTPSLYFTTHVIKAWCHRIQNLDLINTIQAIPRNECLLQLGRQALNLQQITSMEKLYQDLHPEYQNNKDLVKMHLKLDIKSRITGQIFFRLYNGYSQRIQPQFSKVLTTMYAQNPNNYLFQVAQTQEGLQYIQETILFQQHSFNQFNLVNKYNQFLQLQQQQQQQI